VSEQIKLSSFTASFKIESEPTFLAVHLNLFIIDRAERVEFDIIKLDFIFHTDSFDRSSKSLNDDGNFIKINDNVLIEWLTFVLEVSDLLLDLLHTTIFHVGFITFETNFGLKELLDVRVADE